MQRFVFLLFLLTLTVSYAQTPRGTLYLSLSTPLTQKAPSFGQVELPETTFLAIDTLQIDDLLAHETTLYCVAGSQSYTHVGGLLLYDIPSGKRSAVIAMPRPRNVGLWNNILLVSCEEAPFVRAFATDAEHQALFNLDTDVVDLQPHHFMVRGDRVYLVTEKGVSVIGLPTRSLLEEKLYRIDNEFFQSAGTGTYIVELAGELYVDFPLYTAVPRFLLMRLVDNEPVVETLKLVEFFPGLRRPVAAVDRLYIGGGMTHYLPAADTVIPDMQLQADPFAYHSRSASLFRWHEESNTVQILNDETQTGTIDLPAQFRDGWFIPSPEASVSVSEARVSKLRVYPNPARRLLTLSIPMHYAAGATVTMFDARGISRILSRLEAGSASIQLDVTSLAAGSYFLRIQSAQHQDVRHITIAP